MNNEYYREVKDAFNDWANTYEDDVIPKLEQRGYSYNELGTKIGFYIFSVPSITPNVLELGIGTGVLGIFVIKNLKREINLSGLDIAEEMLEKAKEKQIYQNLVCCSADMYEFPSEYDIIYSGFMFHSVKDQEGLLNRIYQSLTKGGYFLMIDLIPNKILQGNNYDHNAHSKKYEHGAPSNYKSDKELMSMFSNSPFEIIGVEKMGIDKDYNHFLYVLQKI